MSLSFSGRQLLVSELFRASVVSELFRASFVLELCSVSVVLEFFRTSVVLEPFRTSSVLELFRASIVLGRQFPGELAERAITHFREITVKKHGADKHHQLRGIVSTTNDNDSSLRLLT